MKIFRLLSRSGAISIAIGLAGCYTGKIDISDPKWQLSAQPSWICKSIDGSYIERVHLLARQFQDPYHPPRPPGEARYSEGVKLNPIPRNVKTGEMAVDIHQTGQGWEIQLRGTDGAIYSKTSVLKDHPDVGCDENGNLILRSFRARWGAELTAGTAHASERRFRRLADGSLEVFRVDREWVRSMNQAPKQSTEITLVFSPAR